MLVSLFLAHQDKKLKAIVSSRKKATRKKKNIGQLPPEAAEIDWSKVGTSMDKDADICKERYEFLRMCQGGKGPVPWTRDEDKQILALVSEHGKSSIEHRYLAIGLCSRFCPGIVSHQYVFSSSRRSQEMEFHRC